MIKKTIILIILLFNTLVLAPQVYGASIFISNMSDVKVGDNLEVVINLDTKGESVNSILARLDYNEDLLVFAGYRDEDSLIKLWIEAPHAINGVITFSGIIPGGAEAVYDAQNKNKLTPIPIVSLLFEAKRPGVADFSFIENKVLKNDGLGSILETTSETNTLKIKENTTIAFSTNKFLDKTPPTPFSLSFVKASLFSKTPSIIIFDAHDLESGVKAYEAKVGWGTWKSTTSPMPIRLGIFAKTVTVRAYDFEGNFRESSIIIPGSNFVRWVFALILFIVAFFWVRKLIK